MDHSHDLLSLLRKAAFLALLGFAVIFLTAPVLAVLSFVLSIGFFIFFVLLPFAIIGLLIWLPIRTLFLGKKSPMGDILQTGKFLGRAAFIMPAQTCSRVCARARGLGEGLAYRIHVMTCFIGGVFLETVSGGLVGALLGAIAGMRTETLQISIPAGALIGAGLGVIVGSSRIRRSQESFVSRAPERVG